MAHSPRGRFWLEAALASLTGVLCLATLIERDWIEAVFGVDPDANSGSLEWAIVVSALALTIVFTGLARAEWQRGAPATAGD